MLPTSASKYIWGTRLAWGLPHQHPFYSFAMKKATLFLLAGLASAAAARATPHPAPGFGFEENKAQWPAAARYRALVPGGAVWLRRTGFTYDWVSIADRRRADAAQAAQAAAAAGPGSDRSPLSPPLRLHGHAVTVDFVGATAARPLQAAHPLAAYTNYFIGTDSSKWASRVQTYADVTYPQLYAGVDVRVHGSSSGQFEYDVVVAPGASPAPVRLRYRGAAKLRLRADGALAITTSVGEVREQRPVAWQMGADGQRQPVPCRFRLEGTVASFELPAGYDRGRELVIDPVVVQASTYTGRTAAATTTAYDAAGNIYAGGNGAVVGFFFPATPGTYTVPGSVGICVSKFNATGTALLYSTTLGGSPGPAQDCELWRMKTDAAGNLVLVGLAQGRPGFPMLPNSFDTRYGRGKIVLAKLNATGTALLASTYLGGNTAATSQTPIDFTTDASGAIYVCGLTNDPTYPTTAGAYQRNLPAGNAGAGFITRLNPAFSALRWSTLLAAPAPSPGGLNVVRNVRVNAAGLVYFTAEVGPNFPLPAPAASATYAGHVLGCLSATGGQLLYATYLPGIPLPSTTSIYVNLMDLALDAAGNVVVCGTSDIGGVPATAGAFVQPLPPPGSRPTSPFFVARLTPTLNTVLMLAVVARSLEFEDANLALDNCGNMAFVVRLSNSVLAQPVYAPAPASFFGSYSQALPTGMYLGTLSADGSQVLFSAFYGSGTDTAKPAGMAIDERGRYYLLYGPTANLQPGYAVLPGAYRTAPQVPPVGNNFSELVATIIDPQFSAVVRAAFTVTGPVCLSQPIMVASTSTGAGRVRWDFGDGSPRDSANTTLAHTYTRPGTYRVRLLARPAPGACAPPDTTSTLVRVAAPAVRALLPRVYLCPGQPAATLDAGNPGSTYAWNTGATTQTIRVAQPGTYVVAIRTPCGRTDTARVLVPAPPRLVRDSVACAGVVTLRVADPDPAATYLWSTGATTPALTVTEPGRYTLAVSVGGCRFELAAVAGPTGALPTVPNVFTPGPGDALNATFKVPGLPPGSRLRVYSRWGQLVYEAADYRNTWDAAGLGAGSYYYLLENARFCQTSTYKGWVEVIR